MKKILFGSLMAISALSLAAYGARNSGGGGGGGGRPAPAQRSSSGPRNSNTGRPQTISHPTIVRPVEVRPSGGNNRGSNIGGRQGPDQQIRPQQGTRPVHVDNRNPRAIRGDATTVHFRPGIGGHEDWRPVGWIAPRWDRYYPANRIWFVYPVGYTWANVRAVTCQAEFTSPDASNPNNGDIYTSDSSYTAWGPAWSTEYDVASQTISEALDQCAAINGVDPSNPATGSCEPVENPEDSDGCFVSYDASLSH